MGAPALVAATAASRTRLRLACRRTQFMLRSPLLRERSISDEAPTPCTQRTAACSKLPGWPRGLREELAAAYIGLSVTAFRTEVASKRAPQPFWLTRGRKAWLKDALDEYLDRLAGRTSPAAQDDPWQRAIDRSRRVISSS